jgi:aminodeoxyfutalosine deaminase
MTPDPKVELHVHLEGTVGPATLLEIATRNRVTLPVVDEAALRELYRFRDFGHFLEVWTLTTNVLRTERDFRQVVLDYAQSAVTHGCVYLEAIFSPAERVERGANWDELFAGYCAGAAAAREELGLEVGLTPDIYRGAPAQLAMRTVEYAARYSDRGVVGVGLGGLEELPAEPYVDAFRMARDAGLGVVPHAGETTAASDVRVAVELLGARRVRHGIRAIDDRALVRDLVARDIVLDVCLTSNLRTGAVPALDAHPLPDLVAAGVRCSLSTDDPAMFETDLTREYSLAAEVGVSARSLYEAGLAGALCDAETRRRLQDIRDTHPWTDGRGG